jgi:hypothetical protein
VSDLKKKVDGASKDEACVDSISADDGMHLVLMSDAEFKLWQIIKPLVASLEGRKAKTGYGIEDLIRSLRFEAAELDKLKAKRVEASNAGARAAAVRHAEMREERALVQAWWWKHGAPEGMKKNAAADEIKRLGLVTAEWETVLKWLQPKHLGLTSQA